MLTILLYYYLTILWYCNVNIDMLQYYLHRICVKTMAEWSGTVFTLTYEAQCAFTLFRHTKLLLILPKSYCCLLAVLAFHKGHNHHLTLFHCKVRQSSPTASTGRSSLSEKNLSDSLPQSEIGYSWKIFPGLLAFGLFWTVSFLRRKRLRDDGYVDVKKSSDDQNNKLKKTRESGMPI